MDGTSNSTILKFLNFLLKIRTPSSIIVYLILIILTSDNYDIPFNREFNCILFKHSSYNFFISKPTFF